CSVGSLSPGAYMPPSMRARNSSATREESVFRGADVGAVAVMRFSCSGMQGIILLRRHRHTNQAPRDPRPLSAPPGRGRPLSGLPARRQVVELLIQFGQRIVDM